MVPLPLSAYDHITITDNGNDVAALFEGPCKVVDVVHCGQVGLGFASKNRLAARLVSLIA